MFFLYLMTTTHDPSYITNELQHGVNDEKGGQLQGHRQGSRRAQVCLFLCFDKYILN